MKRSVAASGRRTNTTEVGVLLWGNVRVTLVPGAAHQDTARRPGDDPHHAIRVGILQLSAPVSRPIGIVDIAFPPMSLESDIAIRVFVLCVVAVRLTTRGK